MWLMSQLTDVLSSIPKNPKILARGSLWRRICPGLSGEHQNKFQKLLPSLKKEI